MKGKAVIKAVLRKHFVSPETFFGRGHARHVVSARVDAIERMSALGMNNHAIARVMQRNPSTVFYWLRPAWRQRRRDYYQRHWADRRPPPQKPAFKVPTEKREELLALHREGNHAEVARLQSELGVSRKYTQSLAAKLQRKKSGADCRLSLPVLAPVRNARPVRSPALQTAEAGA